MGTNYYVQSKSYSIPDKIHIGKSSFGWTFALHIYPELDIHTLNDWIPILESSHIRDEYSREISYEDMLNIITHRKGTNTKFKNSVYYADEIDFHSKNFSEPGPNNLVRPKITKDRFCVGHGINEDGSEGTWSYIIGKFS